MNEERDVLHIVMTILGAVMIIALFLMIYCHAQQVEYEKWVHEWNIGTLESRGIR